MYRAEAFTGSESLPDRTLCLTYDDGPGETTGPGHGPRTVELARYLRAEKVPATFFMVGRHVRELPDVPDQVRALGHLVANHTDTHRHLPEVLRLVGAGAVVDEIATTDLALAGSAGPVTFVRAPYGDWTPEVAAALNDSSHVSVDHVGPIGWDVDGQDWHHWGSGASPESCAETYVEAIQATGRGVVLMHDCTADPGDEGLRLKGLNRTLELTQLLVPELKRLGYVFVRLDEIPALVAAADNA